MSSQSHHSHEFPVFDFDRFFDDAFNARVGRVLNYNDNGDNDRPGLAMSRNLALSAFKPRMDLHENGEANLTTVLLELPGVRKEDIDVQVQNGRLTVTAENKLPVEFEESGYSVREIRYGHFLRTIQLPRDVEAKDVTANLENGILRLTFPQNASREPSGSPQKVWVS